MAKENYIPEGFHALTPMLAIRHADKAIEWYKNAFNAIELNRLTDRDGTIAHAELKISDAVFMIAVKQGAMIIFPVKDQFYGDRAGRIQDPFGHMWIISTHIKTVTPAEMQKQMDTMMN